MIAELPNAPRNWDRFVRDPDDAHEVRIPPFAFVSSSQMRCASSADLPFGASLW
jgi:hypothetical protein